MGQAQRGEGGPGFGWVLVGSVEGGNGILCTCGDRPRIVPDHQQLQGNHARPRSPKRHLHAATAEAILSFLVFFLVQNVML